MRDREPCVDLVNSSAGTMSGERPSISSNDVPVGAARVDVGLGIIRRGGTVGLLTVK